MRTSVYLLAASAVVMAGAIAIAAVPGPEGADHNGHHPVAPQPNAQAVPKQAADRTATMERHMKAMQEMRQKMAIAKTPAAMIIQKINGFVGPSGLAGSDGGAGGDAGSGDVAGSGTPHDLQNFAFGLLTDVHL